MDNIFIDEFIKDLGQETGAKVSDEELLQKPAINQIVKRQIRDYTNLIMKYNAKTYESKNSGKNYDEVDGYRDEFNKMLAQYGAEYDAAITELQRKGEI